MELLRLAMVLCVVLSRLTAQTAPSRSDPEQRYKLFQDYLVRRAAEVTRSFPGEIKTLGDTYTLEKVVFQSMPSLYITGNLYPP